jgi:predicted metal-binding protein
MPPVLTICSDCERQALRRPKQGEAMTKALTSLIQLLLLRKGLRELEVVREPCLQNCPLGRICVVLQRSEQKVRHHLDPKDDLGAVAVLLAGCRPSRATPKDPR